jgi:hypothetical protein
MAVSFHKIKAAPASGSGPSPTPPPLDYSAKSSFRSRSIRRPPGGGRSAPGEVVRAAVKIRFGHQ